MSKFTFLFVCILFLAVPFSLVYSQTACDPTPPWSFNPPVYSGVASYFNATAQGGSSLTTGACGWIKNNNDLGVGAYTASTASAECTLCGNCYSVTGSQGTRVVRVIDYCDLSAGACGITVPYQWTLQTEVFQAVCGSTGQGHASVTWTGPVACPVTGNLLYTGLSGNGSATWTSLRVANQRYPITRVEFSNPNVAGNPYYNATRYGGNQWWRNSSPFQGFPFNIRVTDVFGDQVVDSITFAEMSSFATSGTGGNFPAPTPSNTPTHSVTSSITPSHSISPSTTSTASLSASKSRTPSTTRSLTPSKTLTPTASLSHGATPSNSPTHSLTPTHSTTSSLSPTASPAPHLSSITVYHDSLSAGWSNLSWAATYSMACTNPVCSGTDSISYTPSGYDAVYFTCNPACFNSSYYAISFYVNGGSAGGQVLQIQVVNSSHSAVGTAYRIPAPTANQCTLVTVTLAGNLGNPTGLLGGFWIQSLQGGTPAPSQMYIDEIVIMATSQSAQVSMPAIKKREISSEADLLNTFQAVFTDITTFRIGNLVDEKKRDLGVAVVEAVGISADQAVRLENTAQWVSEFNSVAGTNVNPADVGVSVTNIESAPPAAGGGGGIGAGEEAGIIVGSVVGGLIVIGVVGAAVVGGVVAVSVIRKARKNRRNDLEMAGRAAESTQEEEDQDENQKGVKGGVNVFEQGGKKKRFKSITGRAPSIILQSN